MLLIAAIVKLTCPGPILFRQTRLGIHGDTFSMIKFRTMHVDAQEQLSKLKESQGAKGPLFKMENDPRITSVGRWLRRTSLDELPQLINVVQGQMALVGPRPALVEESRHWDRRHFERLNVLPGITGLWQTCGRSRIPWRTALALDVYYVRRRSLTLDFWILARTVLAVATGRGAY